LRPAFAVSVAIAVVLLGMGADAGITWVKKTGLPWLRPTRSALVVAAGRAEPATAPRKSLVRAPQVAAPLTPEPPTPELLAPEPLTPQLLAPERLAVGPTKASMGKAARAESARATADPSVIARESRLLAVALKRLRTGRDYAGALASLSEYDARFPRGLLRNEALLARLDALTALGRSEAALRLLEDLNMSGPRAIELLVLRAELRANAGHYQDAIKDFEVVLSRASAARLRERALYGRASCRARTGNEAAANGDLDEYLARFPHGSHAAEVRRRLNR
jgi:tetratricopeptide (TPR) repeat protein